MLFPYQYVHHSIEVLQTYIQHTVLHVWCKANGPFDITLLHIDFQPIVDEISKNKNDYLLTPIREIYNICQTLTSTERMLLADAFHRNNDIQGLCEGTVKPVPYDQLEPISHDLVMHLKQFSKDLYSHVLGLKPFYDRCGKIDDHYDEFMRVNHIGKCPFCGINDVMSENLPSRDAYDHYLPKHKYPFNTVNLLNLVPACKTCNTSFKLTYDPIVGGQRKAFYPFSMSTYSIDITVAINFLNYANPKQNKVSLQFACSTLPDQVITWRTIYKIDAVYSDKCSSEDSKYWIEQVHEELHNHTFLFGQQVDPKTYLNYSIKSRKKHPMQDYNFIRVPFLEGCIAYGLFD